MTGAETDPALRKLLRARAALVVTQPFWGVLALHLRVVERPDVETMATDGESLFYAPAFVLALSDPELRGVVAHEVEHVARLHHTRRGNRNPDGWNLATDHAINPGLLKGGFKLPAGALNDPQYAGMSAERIYAKRAKDGVAKPAPRSGHGAPGQETPQTGSAASPTPSQGPRAGGAPAQAQGSANGHPGGFGQVMDAPGGPAARAEAEAKASRMVREAAMIAKGRGAGVMAGMIEDVLANLDRPRVDWRARLSRFADESAIRETCWTKPSHRYQTEFFLPGSESVAPSHLVLAIDKSGSMSQAALNAIGGHAQAMMDSQAAERLTVIYFDTDVRKVETYDAGDQFKLASAGNGGTCFAPLFKWLEREAADASALIVMSDLGCSDPHAFRAPPCPVLWANTDRPRQMGFGEVVQIDAHG